MTTKKKKIKRIRAWAVVVVARNGESQIEFADSLVDNECPAAEPTYAMAIYHQRKLAERVRNDCKIVPVIIEIKSLN